MSVQVLTIRLPWLRVVVLVDRLPRRRAPRFGPTAERREGHPSPTPCCLHALWETTTWMSLRR